MVSGSLLSKARSPGNALLSRWILDLLGLVLIEYRDQAYTLDFTAAVDWRITSSVLIISRTGSQSGSLRRPGDGSYIRPRFFRCWIASSRARSTTVRANEGEASRSKCLEASSASSTQSVIDSGATRLTKPRSI